MKAFTPRELRLIKAVKEEITAKFLRILKEELTGETQDQELLVRLAEKIIDL